LGGTVQWLVRHPSGVREPLGFNTAVGIPALHLTSGFVFKSGDSLVASCSDAQGAELPTGAWSGVLE
jgi:hypothetical protein